MTIQYKSGIANAYLIQAEDGYIAFDTGSICDADVFTKIQRANRISPDSVKLIVISHEHDDHFVNANHMRELTGAPILCHKNAVETISNGRTLPLYPRNKYGRWIVENLFKGDIPFTEVPCVSPDIVIQGDYDLRPYGIDAKLIETPGHSLGSISLITSRREAYIGDVIVAQNPTIERPCCVAYFCYTEDTPTANAQILPNVQMLLESADVFYSGHGGPFSREEVERAYQEAIEEAAGIR